MQYFNFELEYNNSRGELVDELNSLNEEKNRILETLVLFLDANKDVFHGAYGFDFSSINNVDDLKGEFDYWTRSVRDARRNAERTSNLYMVLNKFYTELSDKYNKISETNDKIEKLDEEYKNNVNVDGLKDSVEFINNITAIGNKVGEKRNKIAILTNYINNIDTDDFMKADHRRMIEDLNADINLDLVEIYKLLASRNLSIDNYSIFRSNIRFNLANIKDSGLSLDTPSYDVIYHEYSNLSDIRMNNLNPVSSAPAEPVVEEPEVNAPVEPVVEESEEVKSAPSTDDEELEVEEREPIEPDSPVEQFKDDYKHSVKGISSAGSKLKEKICSKLFCKSALRWVGVVGVLSAALLINPALLLGGAAIGAGVYEYNIAKKMK